MTRARPGGEPKGNESNFLPAMKNKLLLLLYVDWIANNDSPAPPHSRGQGKCLNAFSTTTLCQFISTTSRVWMDSRESSAISTTWLLEFNYLSDFTPSDGSQLTESLVPWPHQTSPKVCQYGFDRAMSFFSALISYLQNPTKLHFGHNHGQT